MILNLHLNVSLSRVVHIWGKIPMKGKQIYLIVSVILNASTSWKKIMYV